MLTQRAHSQKLIECLGDLRSNPLAVIKHLKTEYDTPWGLDFPKVIQQGYYLKQLEHEQGESTSIKILVLLFSDLCNSFNVKQNMTDHQLAVFSFDFFQNYSKGLNDDPSYTIEDVAIFCQQAKTGKYGKVYQSIDGSILNEWLAIYDRERYENYQRHLIQSEKLEAEMDREIKNPPSEETMSKFREKYQQVVNTLGQPIESDSEVARRQSERIGNKKKLFYGEGADEKDNEAKKVKATTDLPDKEKRLQEFWKLKLGNQQKDG